MILFYNPKATRPRNRRFPLSILAIAAAVEGREEYAIVDGNLDPNPTETLIGFIKQHPVELLAVTVMPGPQTVGAVASCSEIRSRFPDLPIVWGGYFASNYTAAALNAGYVDYAVRGQGEQTFLDLLEAIRGHRDLNDIAGLSYKNADGKACHNPERPMNSRFRSNHVAHSIVLETNHRVRDFVQSLERILGLGGAAFAFERKWQCGKGDHERTGLTRELRNNRRGA